MENALLSRPPLIHEAAASASSLITFEPLANDFVGSLKQVLHAYVGDSDLNIAFAAQLCGTSKRSLQRNLTDTGTRYSEVLDQARFDVASHMLQAPGTKMAHVANRLGYSNATHFSRAFRRFTGVTPRQYRQKYAH